jgi:hypothetical protein
LAELLVLLLLCGVHFHHQVALHFRDFGCRQRGAVGDQPLKVLNPVLNDADGRQQSGQLLLTAVGGVSRFEQLAAFGTQGLLAAFQVLQFLSA